MEETRSEGGREGERERYLVLRLRFEPFEGQILVLEFVDSHGEAEGAGAKDDEERRR
jgi:hypothetical protein